MRINDYEFIDPRDSDAGQQLRALGRRSPSAGALGRLVQCLKEFALRDTELSCRVISGEIEIYLVPPRYVLAHLPDCAALVRVNHESEQIDIVAVINEYGGYDESQQWEQVITMAGHFI